MHSIYYITHKKYQNIENIFGGGGVFLLILLLIMLLSISELIHNKQATLKKLLHQFKFWKTSKCKGSAEEKEQKKDLKSILENKKRYQK